MKKENFRKFTTSSGKLVLAGKDAEQNEKVIEQAQKEEFLLHTELPGSPFCNIKSPEEEVSKEDIKETALFCAKYSQAWKKAKTKKDVIVHIFLRKDVFKDKDMKTGTFGVKKLKSLTVKKEDIEKL